MPITTSTHFGVFSVELSGGRKLSVERFQFDRTYAGLLEGRPSAEINQRILAATRDDLRTFSPLRSGRLLPPRLAAPDAWIPPARYMAHLESEPLTTAGDISELVIAWFDAVPDDRPIATIIAAMAEQIPWSRWAVDSGV